MKTVLVVDDETSFLQFLRDGLKAWAGEFSVLVCSNGAEAAEVLAAGGVDLVLTDLQMPEMNGFELLAFMSARCPETPVMVMTAFGTPQIEQKLRDRGIRAYLEKPLDLDAVVAEIRAVLAEGGRTGGHGVSLLSFLPLLAMEKTTCRLTVRSRGRTGVLDFAGGHLVDAGTAEQRGDEAAVEMISWPSPTLEIGPALSRQRLIETSLDDLLLQALARIDEAARVRFQGNERDELAAPDVVEPEASPRSPGVRIDIGRLNQAQEAAREDLGAALLASEIALAGASSPVVSLGGPPHASELLLGLPDSFASGLQASAFPPMDRYFLADLEGDRLVVVLLFGPFRWGMLVDSSRAQLGFLLNLVIPRAAAALAEAQQPS